VRSQCIKLDSKVALLQAIGADVVGNRPDRVELRLKKRRPKQYKHLREPRQNYKRKAA
jgi:hypothetical protein